MVLKYDFDGFVYKYTPTTRETLGAIKQELKFANKEDLIEYILNRVELESLFEDFKYGIKELLEQKAHDSYRKQDKGMEM